MKSIKNSLFQLPYSFSFRLTLSFLLIILLMATAIGGGIFAIGQMLNESGKLAQIQEAQSSLGEIKMALLEKDFQISQLVLLNRYQTLYDYTHKSDDALPKLLSQYVRQETVAQQNLTRKEKEESAKFLANLQNAQANLNKSVDGMVQQLQLGNLDEAVLILQNEFNSGANDFNKLLTDKIRELDPQVRQQKDATAQTSASSQFFLLISGIGVGLIALFLALTLSVLLSRRIKALERAVISLGQGNLQARIARPGRDELGRVGTAFNQMAEQLMALLTDIEGKRKLGRAAGQGVGVIVTQLSSMASDQTQIASEQSATVLQVTSSLEELAVTVRQIAERTAEVAANADATLVSATRVKEMATQTNQAGKASQECSTQTVLSINQVETRLSAAREVLAELVKKSDSINSIVELISSIADETHLLSLNGAIEAAGAGEAGERFAVVAQSIRELAHRTSNAAAGVSDHIGEVRAAVEELERAIEETAVSCQEGVQLSQEAGTVVLQLSEAAQEMDERFGQIVHSMSGVVQLADQIKISTYQQDSASTQLTQTMRALSATSQVIASSSQQLAQTTYQLQNVSDDLLEKLAS